MQVLYEREYVSRAHPPGPHVLNGESVVELGKIGGERSRVVGMAVVLVDSLEERRYSPTDSV